MDKPARCLCENIETHIQVSGFPNMTAISLEDATGRTYVKTWDFLKVGILSSILTYIVLVTVGYALMVYVNGW